MADLKKHCFITVNIDNVPMYIPISDILRKSGLLYHSLAPHKAMSLLGNKHPQI
jgi:hypothetical protein